MRKRLWLAVSLLVALVLLVSGCIRSTPPQPAPVPAPPSGVLPAEHPKGMKSLRWLTEAEKAKVIDIALNTPEAKKAQEKYGVYETRLSWLAANWNDGKISEY